MDMSLIALVQLVHGGNAARALRDLALVDPEGAQQLAAAALDPCFVIEKMEMEREERRAAWDAEHPKPSRMERREAREARRQRRPSRPCY